MPQVHVAGLYKHYRVHHKAPGLAGSVRSLFRREYETVKAVDGLSFDIAEGEIVGFLGPNGAGKTTTLKCLSGLLYPTRGEVTVLGYIPYRRQREYLSQFTLIMGQRNQLMWDLPAMETFLVNQAIYDVPERQFRESLDELVALLALEPLLTKQVRKLSLGERMRCELAGSLLHRPRVLFLDEPTIGLDVTAQAAIREFILAYNRKYAATVLLTSHYMADVTALAERVLVIDQGQLRYDGNLRALVETTAPYKLLQLTLERPMPAAELVELGMVESNDGLKVRLRVPRAQTRASAARALTLPVVTDVTIEDPPIEEILRQIFRENEAAANA